MGETLFSTLNGGIQPPASPSDSAAMKLQKFYRGYRTRRLLADSTVVLLSPTTVSRLSLSLSLSLGFSNGGREQHKLRSKP
ncbi:hypothetical protein L1987_78751 [Smallanthus sonchifolius]|uniref:Uncharacterized protein n=1 Tax=Smallanthus sonchifolius TaxID=185202 RepID=A0ACB8ZDD2_9ASTR|nr:hypothetical protein L1987_78751 [Smallanthus sonchifolius]